MDNERKINAEGEGRRAKEINGEKIYWLERERMTIKTSTGR